MGAEMIPEMILLGIGALIAVPGLLVIARAIRRAIRRWINADQLEWVRTPKVDRINRFEDDSS